MSTHPLRILPLSRTLLLPHERGERDPGRDGSADNVLSGRVEHALHLDHGEEAHVLRMRLQRAAKPLQEQPVLRRPSVQVQMRRSGM